MQNYFNYFTEIEQRFQQRRGSILMLSTLDWALIDNWREAGVPLDAVLRGIDDAFDKHEAQVRRAKGRTRRINGLAWAAQAVLQAAEAQVEAATGLPREPHVAAADSGFERGPVAAFLAHNAESLASADAAVAARLQELAAEVLADAAPPLEELDRILVALETSLVARLTGLASEEEMVGLRGQFARELAPYRGRLQAVQIRQMEQQFLTRRLLEARGLPRLSLFYLRHGETEGPE